MIVDTADGRPALARSVLALTDGCAVACYFFDLHADGAAQWDHAGAEFDDKADIEHRARALLAEAVAAGTVRDATITVFVHEGSRGVVLTALARPGAEIELVWA